MEYFDVLPVLMKQPLIQDRQELKIKKEFACCCLHAKRTTLNLRSTEEHYNIEYIAVYLAVSSFVLSSL